MKSILMRSLFALWLASCGWMTPAAAQTITPAPNDPQVQQLPSITQPSMILFTDAANYLNGIFNFTANPKVSMLARNAGSVEVWGVEKTEKLKSLVIDYCASHPMQPDDFVRCMLPGPVISDDRDADVQRYQHALSVYFEIHPEVRWCAPTGVLGMVEDRDMCLKIIDMQLNSGNYIGLLPADKQGASEQIKQD